MERFSQRRIERELNRDYKINNSIGSAIFPRHKDKDIKNKKGFTIVISVLSLITFIMLVVSLGDYEELPTEADNTRDRITMASLVGQYIDAVGGIMNIPKSRPGTTGRDTGRGVSEEDISFAGEGLGSNPSKVLEGLELTEVEKKMAAQYSAIIEGASKDAGIPSWALYLISYLERSPLSNFPLRIGDAGFTVDEFGTTRNGKVIDYYTYGKEEAAQDGKLELNDDYRGPFQLKESEVTKRDFNGDGVADIYNYADAALMAAYHVKNKKDHIERYFSNQGVALDENTLWMLSLGANNSGQGGFNWRFPNDTYEVLKGQMQAIQSHPKMREMSESYYSQGRSSPEGRGKMYEILDELGWKVDSETRSKSWNRNVNWTQPILDISVFEGYWPGKSNGDRGKSQRLPTANTNREFMAFEHNGIPVFMGNNRQNMEYIVSSYAIGTMMRDTLYVYFGGQIETTEHSPVALALQEGYISLDEVREHNIKHSGYSKSEIESILDSVDLGLKVGQKKVLYNWEAEQLEKGIPFSEIKRDNNAMNKLGPYGEVGYKGGFPLFVQGTNLNYVANIPWKFQGRRTTLGTSGCSVYALMSLIHGAGDGDKPIPNHGNSLPTFQNVARILDNGPIVSNHVKNGLGYTVAVFPTTTNKDMDKIWEKLEQGVPFVVNVNSRQVTAYDEYLVPNKTRFTSGGHFILLVGGYRQNGKRMVEVVQSTGSSAGLKKVDQNRAVFDYDELVSKKVIRSSFGSAVPAYTITGGKGLPTPRYLNNNYEVPDRVETTVRDSVEIESDSEDIVIDLFTIQ